MRHFTRDDRETARLQPPGSRITLRRNDAGMTLSVPPLGLVRGSSGLAILAAGWTAAAAWFTPKWWGAGRPFAILAMIPFWGVAAGLWAGTVYRARRRTVIDVVDGTLVVTEATLWRVRQHEWRREQLWTIWIAEHPSNEGTTPFGFELWILPADAPHVAILLGHSTDELEWVAATLRLALGMSNVPECRR